jgi:hypothetical protein
MLARPPWLRAPCILLAQPHAEWERRGSDAVLDRHRWPAAKPVRREVNFGAAKLGLSAALFVFAPIAPYVSACSALAKPGTR